MATTWTDLAEGVAAALAWAEFETSLVIIVWAPPGARYRDLQHQYFVQFIHEGDRIVAEAVTDDDLLGERKIGAVGAERLAALGWRSLDEPGDHYNWWIELPWPASSAGYRRIGGVAVATLREVFGVGSPGDLGYRAWTGRGAVVLELPGLGLQLIPN